MLAIYAITLAAAVWLLPPGQHEWGFFANVALLSAVLILVCWLKGEPPRWRWGKR